MSNTLQSAQLLAFPFRPFFLFTGIYGLVTVLAWMSFLFGGMPLPLGWSAIHWHSHEMLFGLVSAAIAGFLLTAMCNWTGAQPLNGGSLLALIGVWIAGRFFMWTATWWPTGVVAVVDSLFLFLLAFYVLHVLLRHDNKRNLILVGILLLLGLANLLMHVGFITRLVHWLQMGQLMAFNLITLMMVVIGGRIIPLFTANWLRNNGTQPEVVKSFTAVDRVALITTALLIPVELFTTMSWPTGIIALVAAGAHLIRLAGWSGWRTLSEPLLWILHLAYAWIILALLFKGIAAFDLVPPTVWQHALGVGGIATLILGVMTRVALGHTGRPFKLPVFGIGIYIAITLAAMTRLSVSFELLNFRWGLLLAAAGWALAFALFVVLYWPILSRPRADGRPG